MSGSMGATMEVLVAVIAFAGALLAAITTGVLIGRLRDEPTGWLVAWAITTGALCLSLGVVATGHLVGFGSTTYRAFQITGALLAPLWLAVGVLQLLAEKGSARFTGWLLGIALTVVGMVIMLFDPVSGAFAKELPFGAVHWDIWPEWLLRGVHGLVVVMLVLSLAVALLSSRDGDDYDADNMNATLALTPTGIALAGSLELTLPGLFVVVPMIATVGAIWYSVARPLAPYEDDDEEDVDAREMVRENPRDNAGVDARKNEWESEWEGRGAVDDRPVPLPVPDPPRRSGLGDLVAEYRAGEQVEVDYAARMQPSDGFGGPATGQLMPPDTYGAPREPEYGMPAAAQPQQEFGMPATGVVFPGAEPGPALGAGPGPVPRHGPMSAPMPTGPAQNPPLQSGPMQPGPMQPGPLQSGPFQSGPLHSGPMASSPLQGSGPLPSAPGQGSTVRPSPSIYGLLTVFTLMDGSGDAFDKLAEETVEAVQRNEPDTLIFACHGVKSAPLQRIVYELYRDEVGFSEHQRQPHMERFATERQALVLATNVIELNVNAAKVVPLPTAFRF